MSEWDLLFFARKLENLECVLGLTQHSSSMEQTHQQRFYTVFKGFPSHLSVHQEIEQLTCYVFFFFPSSESYPEVSIPIPDSHHLIFFYKTSNDAQAEPVSATQTLPSTGKVPAQPCLARLWVSDLPFSCLQKLNSILTHTERTDSVSPITFLVL